MDWHGLIGMTKEQLQQAKTHFAPDKNLSVVVEECDLPLLGKLSKAIDEVKPKGLHALLFRTQDEPLFPTAPKLLDIPWKVGNYYRVNLQLHFEQDAADKERQNPTLGEKGERSPKGRPPSWAVCLTSNAEERANGLQADYGTL